MKIFKCEAQGYIMHFSADTIDAARACLTEVTDDKIPEELLIWAEVDELPAGEETS